MLNFFNKVEAERKGFTVNREAHVVIIDDNLSYLRCIPQDKALWQN